MIACRLVSLLVVLAVGVRHDGHLRAVQVAVTKNASQAAVVVTNMSTVTVNASAMVNATAMVNASATMNATAVSVKANPTPARLRVCNAYKSGDSLTVEVGHPVRKRSASATPYRACSEIKMTLKAGDPVMMRIGELTTAAYLPWDPYAPNAVVMVVVYPRASQVISASVQEQGHHAVATAGLDLKLHYFRNLKYPQVAAVDAVTFGTKKENIAIRPHNPKISNEPIAYDKVGPIDPGMYDVQLDGKTAGSLQAVMGESYVIMRLKEGEVAVYPEANAFGAARGQGIACFLPLLLLAVLRL